MSNLKEIIKEEKTHGSLVEYETFILDLEVSIFCTYLTRAMVEMLAW